MCCITPSFKTAWRFAAFSMAREADVELMKNKNAEIHSPAGVLRTAGGGILGLADNFCHGRRPVGKTTNAYVMRCHASKANVKTVNFVFSIDI